ncbi:MAG: divalent metal cation transporter [Planctomycetota bacterium]|nr:divalent metal cation transporter [Planctomycetota bacterium]
MAAEDSKVEADRQMLAEAREQGMLATLAAYMRMSGPGWLQSAITLGGGSLGSSLYLGVIGGYELLWVQPLAMLLGIIMLSAIGYVTLSTGDRPFRAINAHVNPVLGWGWALAVAAANVVWCLPQYALANGVLSQNLLPGWLGDKNVVGEDGWVTRKATEFFGTDSYWSTHCDELVVALSILIIATIVTWSYDRGGWGVWLYETMLKIVVAMIVLCFFGVVVKLTFATGNPLDWSRIFGGFVPDFGLFFKPSSTYAPLLESLPAGAVRDYWTHQIVDRQQDILISAAATAVGINMTFLFAYSLLRKGWTKEFRGLVKFDLATGMLIPFLLATSCVVIAAASQFHTEGFDENPDGSMFVPAEFQKPFEGLLAGRDAAREEARQKEIDARDSGQPLDEQTAEAVAQLMMATSFEEGKLASTLIKRDAFHLARSLQPVTGEIFANYIFGFGVLAMTLSTITILMLISGFVFCELLGLPQGGWAHRLGTLVAGIGGAFGPFIWKQASFYLVVPTSVFGYILLPLAYLTFFLLMNQKDYLGENAPTGMRRLVWNLLMAVSAGVATVGSVYMAHKKAGYYGIGAIVLLVVLVVLVHFNRVNRRKYDQQARSGKKKQTQ